MARHLGLQRPRKRQVGRMVCRTGMEIRDRWESRKAPPTDTAAASRKPPPAACRGRRHSAMQSRAPPRRAAAAAACPRDDKSLAGRPCQPHRTRALDAAQGVQETDEKLVCILQGEPDSAGASAAWRPPVLASVVCQGTSRLGHALPGTRRNGKGRTEHPRPGGQAVGH